MKSYYAEESEELTSEMLESDVDSNELRTHLGLEPVRVTDVHVQPKNV